MGMSHSSQSANNQSTGTSASLNQAYPSLSASLGGQTAYTGQSNNVIANLLGLNGAQGSQSGLNSYLDSSGYNFTKDQGMQGINSNNAAKGLLDSGSALKGVQSYGSGLASTYLDKYMAGLSGLSGSGLQASQVLSGAGNTANSQSQSTGSSSGSATSVSLK